MEGGREGGREGRRKGGTYPEDIAEHVLWGGEEGGGFSSGKEDILVDGPVGESTEAAVA